MKTAKYRRCDIPVLYCVCCCGCPLLMLVLLLPPVLAPFGLCIIELSLPLAILIELTLVVVEGDELVDMDIDAFSFARSDARLTRKARPSSSRPFIFWIAIDAMC